MTTTWINKSATWLVLGALAANTGNAEPIKIAAQEGFASSQSQTFKSQAFPEPTCNTSAAVHDLRQAVRMSPLPTFDGVSPWPGLFGFWTHQKAGMYVVVRGQNTYRVSSLNRSATRSKQLLIKVKVYDLCSHTLIGSGSSSFNGSVPIRIKLGNHSLNNVVRPFVTLTPLGDAKSKVPDQGMLGFTLQYRQTTSSKDSLIKESILLRNVLNL